MRFIATGDVGGEVEILNGLLKLDLQKYDFVVFTGDLVGTRELRKVGEATARRLKTDVKIDYPDIKNRLDGINRVFVEAKKRTRVYGILGNSDLGTFVSLVPRMEFESIHDRIVRVGDNFVIGYQGRPMNIDELERSDDVEESAFFPGRTYGERAKECNGWPEDKAHADISRMLATADPRKCVLITHYPPFEILDRVEERNVPWAIAAYGERSRHGHIGSQAFLQVTRESGILLHVFSHVHESKGIVRMGNTTYVNLGSLEDDRDMCEAEIENDRVQIRFLKV